MQVKLYKKHRGEFAFLQSRNKTDFHLFREILVSLLFDIEYGAVMSPWQDVAGSVSNVQSSVNKLLFGDSDVFAKGCTETFRAVTEQCFKHQKYQYFWSRYAEEAPPSEIFFLIEEVYERYEEVK